MEMNDKIRALRKQHNLTLEEVGKIVGVGKSTVRKWETGDIANMRRDKISLLAQALHTTPTYLMGWEDEDSNEIPTTSNIIPVPRMTKVPLVRQIACGTPILAEENIMDYIDTPESTKADFALRCKGDSMTGAGINDGDVVYIHKQCTVENGQIAAVIIDDEATLKRFYHNGDMVRLVAENPAFPTMVLVGEEINQLRIAGRAIAYTHVL